MAPRPIRWPELGIRLRDARQYQQLLQGQLAESIGTTRGAIAQFESGRFRPDAETLARLCRRLSLESVEMLQLAGYVPVIEGERWISVPHDAAAALEVLAGYSPAFLVKLEAFAHRVIEAGGWPDEVRASEAVGV